MKYLVTYCALDEQFAGNYFWHTCILLSHCVEGEKIKVVDNWGFYGLPSTSRHSYLDKLKIRLGLDVDFLGNHGMLRHEDLRFLETGFGLHGVTFEVTEEKFNLLQQKCQKMAVEQDDAINEIVEVLKIKAKDPENTRIYPYENLSPHILAFEKAKAHQENRSSRLKRFELKPRLTLWGPTINQSRTCKSQIIKILNGILTSDQMLRLTMNGVHPTAPRYSGPMENMYLHSSGPLRQHKKSSGQIVYYRDFQDEGVDLHWTLPPQEIEALSDETLDLLAVSDVYCEEIKLAIGRLQQLEWLFINAKLPEEYQMYRETLIQCIRECFTQFSSVKFCNMNIVEKLKNVENLFSSLYAAIADGWAFHTDSTTDEEDYYNPFEALAAYLTIKDKQKLCSIIGRSYLEPPLDRMQVSIFAV